MDPYQGLAETASWAQAGADGVAIAVALAAVFVIFRGARMLLGMIRGGSDGPDDGGYSDRQHDAATSWFDSL